MRIFEPTALEFQTDVGCCQALGAIASFAVAPPSSHHNTNWWWCPRQKCANDDANRNKRWLMVMQTGECRIRVPVGAVCVVCLVCVSLLPMIIYSEGSNYHLSVVSWILKRDRTGKEYAFDLFFCHLCSWCVCFRYFSHIDSCVCGVWCVIHVCCQMIGTRRSQAGLVEMEMQW